MKPRMQIASLLIALIALIARVATAASHRAPARCCRKQAPTDPPPSSASTRTLRSSASRGQLSPTPNSRGSASAVVGGARLPDTARHRGSRRHWRPPTGTTTCAGLVEDNQLNVMSSPDRAAVGAARRHSTRRRFQLWPRLGAGCTSHRARGQRSRNQCHQHLGRSGLGRQGHARGNDPVRAGTGGHGVANC